MKNYLIVFEFRNGGKEKWCLRSGSFLEALERAELQRKDKEKKDTIAVQIIATGKNLKAAKREPVWKDLG